MIESTWGHVLKPGGGARFRLWAPAEEQVRLLLASAEYAMNREADGWFSADIDAALPGTDYSYVLGDGQAMPDPAARMQAGDVHGPSRLTDPCSYHWRDTVWRGRAWEEAVIYEVHIGTFTPEGTFRAAIDRLDHLAATGITALEIMPVAQFAGNQGWGYDGVLLYAPHPTYGAPDDLKALVDAAHARGLMVLLDVVYNHFGPDGNYLHVYAPDFFDAERQTPWGSAIAYQRPQVRAFFLENALYWLDEFHLDGLRLDAVDQVRDPESEVELLIEVARRVRSMDFNRPIHLTTEDNRNLTVLHERSDGGAVDLYTAEWNDDFHNTAHVLATGETEGYYADFRADPVRSLACALSEGFVYQGQTTVAGDRRGAPSAQLPPVAFIDFLQNHDQTGNRAFGERLVTLTDPDRLQALTAILLLSPHIPLLFMGEEWGETRPFLFFTDFHGNLADAVREGRRREFRYFSGFRDPAMRATIPDPNDPESFRTSKINWPRRDSSAGRAQLDFVTRLLETRRRAIIPRLARSGGHSGRIVEGAEGIVAVDWRLDGGLLQLRTNLGDTTQAAPVAAGEILHASLGATNGAPFAPNGVLVAFVADGAGA